MKKALVVASFNDVGTGKSFVAGKTVTLDEGTFQNYELAGLVRDPDGADQAAEAAPAVKPGRRARAIAD